MNWKEHFQNAEPSPKSSFGTEISLIHGPKLNTAIAASLTVAAATGYAAHLAYREPPAHAAVIGLVTGAATFGGLALALGLTMHSGASK